MESGDNDQRREQRPMDHISTTGFELVDWQQEAVKRWLATGRGTLDVFTGGGKTKIALSCAGAASRQRSGLKVAVIVPTEALALQWRDAIVADTDIELAQVGLLGAGKRQKLSDVRVLVCVVNSAAASLPAQASDQQPLMLIVDECHRAGAATFSKVLETPAAYTLGLSATPERDEVDEFGEPVAFDDQIVGQKLGPVVFQFTLKDARQLGWLPTFQIHHHGVELRPSERRDYDDLSRRLDDLSERMRGLGIDPAASRRLMNQAGQIGELAKVHVGLTSKRKDLLYRAEERGRVVQVLLGRRLAEEPKPRVLLFHERVDEAIALHNALQASAVSIPGQEVRFGLEHSRLPTRDRRAVLSQFRAGSVDVLVSVKSLIEGIDVPEADVGVSVASTSSVRQRIQALGRVLRRRRDVSPQQQKTAEMHVVYVVDTVDELIYGKEDWSDLTGADANRYWLWRLAADAPEPQPGPPRTPMPTEEQAWLAIEANLGHAALPQPWPGVVPVQEYAADTLGTVTNSLGAIVENPQGATDMVAAVRGRHGGRFYVTPQYRLVILWGDGVGGLQPFVAGRLAEPFRVRALYASAALQAVDVASLSPGAAYPGPTDKRQTLQLRQKRGGIIEANRGKGEKVFAVTDGDSAQAACGRRLLAAWRAGFNSGVEVHVNALGHAWVLAGGQAIFLADVGDGLEWPPDHNDE
jgi:superfamily II DNA or RNA helicase